MADKLAAYAAGKEALCLKNDSIEPGLYTKYGVNRGLRDMQGNGVLTGLTNISKITAFKSIDGKKRRATASFGIAGTTS